jgi:ABC-type glycerol-3-phosphate transport system substrate-binding protein
MSRTAGQSGPQEPGDSRPPSGSHQPADLEAAYRDGRLSRRQFVAGALKLGFSTTAATALLAACHSGSHKATPAKLQGRVQILIGFAGGNSPSQREVQQTLAQAFIAAHPLVGIDFLRATSAATATTELTALVERGSAPDIVLGIDLADVSRLVDQHMWLDLHPLFQRDGVSTKAFASEATAAAALSNYYGGTKAIPGVAVGLHDHALAYNVALFAHAGVTPPPASWSDGSWSYTGSFLDAAQRLTLDRSGRHAGQAGFDPGKVVQFGTARIAPEVILYSFAGHLYQASKRQALLDTSAALRGAQLAGDLVNRYHVQPTAAQMAALGGATAADPTLAAWRAGKLAMIDMCSCDIASGYAAQVPFAWKAAAMPTGPARRFRPLEVSLAGIVAASRQHDLAWEVLKFFCVDPTQEGRLAYNGFGVMPGVSVNLDDFAAGTRQSVGVDVSQWVSGLSGASAENDSWIPAFAQVQELLATALASITAGTAASAVMPRLQQQAQAQIDDWFRANKLPK